MDSLVGRRLEHDAEQTAGAGKIAPPDFVSRIAFEPGMQDAQDFRPFLEPACDAQAGLHVVRRPRSARNMSSGPTHHPIVVTTVFSAGSVLAFADTQPNIMSEWPPIYLV